MPSIRHVANAVDKLSNNKTAINWFPGHMYSGLRAMMGKLNTVDCVVEVHDARIPFTGRNEEFKKHLGLIKPRLLVLNKSDLADLSNWKNVKNKLRKQGDENVLLTDASGSTHTTKERGYTRILENVVRLINQSDRNNRAAADHFKIMIVGIPNVGKSTLINRLRQYHLGRSGQPAEVGALAGVTKIVENRIKICSRPPIYSLDTPGVLEPRITKNHDNAMKLALCSSITDKVLNPIDLARYLLNYLNESQNTLYLHNYRLVEPVETLEQFVEIILAKEKEAEPDKNPPDQNTICWSFIKNFRKGLFGKVMFE